MRNALVVRNDDVLMLNESGDVYRLLPDQPVQMLQCVTVNDDPTSIEVCDPRMLAVTQVTEDGVSQTIMLSPLMALELARSLNAYIQFPTGFEL